MIDQIKASDQWSYYQAKSIKSEVAASANRIMRSLPGKAIGEEDSQATARYEKEKEDIKKKAEEDEKSSEQHLDKHVTFS